MPLLDGLQFHPLKKLEWWVKEEVKGFLPGCGFPFYRNFISHTHTKIVGQWLPGRRPAGGGWPEEKPKHCANSSSNVMVRFGYYSAPNDSRGWMRGGIRCVGSRDQFGDGNQRMSYLGWMKKSPTKKWKESYEAAETKYRRRRVRWRVCGKALPDKLHQNFM